MYDGWHDGWGPGAWIVMASMMLVFWALVAAVVVYLVRTVGHRGETPAGPPPPRQDDALRILDERYARGEIDNAEYTERRELLRQR